MKKLLGGPLDLTLDLIYHIVKTNTEIEQIRDYINNLKVNNYKEALVLLMMTSYIVFNDEENHQKKSLYGIVKSRKTTVSKNEYRFIKHIIKKKWTLDDIKCYSYVDGIESIEFNKLLYSITDKSNKKRVFNPLLYTLERTLF